MRAWLGMMLVVPLVVGCGGDEDKSDSGESVGKLGDEDQHADSRKERFEIESQVDCFRQGWV